MSFSSLLPAPKRSEPEKDSQISRISKDREQVLKALTDDDNQGEAVKKDSIFDSVIGSRLRFQDFVPIRQRNFNMELPRPSQQEIDETYERTKRFMDKILSKNLQPEAATVKSSEQAHAESYELTYETKQPSGAVKTRKLKIVEKAQDPLQPSTIRARKVVAPPVEEEITPLFHKTDAAGSAKTLTQEERAEWDIPAAISSWKNPKGHTLSLDKRLMMDARYNKNNSGPHEVSEGFAQLSNALEVADHQARQNMKVLAESKRRLADEEAREKEQKMHLLAQKAREERENERTSSARLRRRIADHEHDAAERRQVAREARMGELEKDLSKSKMRTADRLRELAYSQGRDVSERVILSAAKATESSESHYDSRLFSKGANASARRHEDQLYDRPLFDQQARDSTNRANLGEIDSMIREDKNEKTGPIQFTEASRDSGQQENKKFGLQTK